jgi:hypothetical protein
MTRREIKEAVAAEFEKKSRQEQQRARESRMLLRRLLVIVFVLTVAIITLAIIMLVKSWGSLTVTGGKIGEIIGNFFVSIWDTIKGFFVNAFSFFHGLFTS